MNWRSIFRAAGIVCAVGLFDPSSGRAASIIDQLRAQAEREFGASNITAGYAALIDFAVNDDVSADRYYIGEGAGQLDVDVYKLPLPFTIYRTKNDWRFFGQATLGYLNAKQEIPSLGPNVPGEEIRSTWRAYAFSFGVGVKIPVFKGFYVEPFAFAGYSRLENDARYYGPVTTEFFQPALKGLLFDWKLDAFVFGASFAVGYKFRVAKLDVTLRSRFTRSEIRVFHVDGDFGKFNTSLMSLRSDVELVHPLPIRLYGRQLDIVGLFSNTTFIGASADALGSSYFFEIGLALQYDLRGYNVIAERVRVGFNGVIGDNITGYSIILKLSF